MTELERYVLEEHVADFNDGLITRRELLRRATLITGSTAASLAILSALGCGTTPSGGNPPATSGSGRPAAAYATPPASRTRDGITVRPDDPRIKAQRVEVKAADGMVLIGYLARPSTGGQAPGVLVCHENRGLVEHIRDVVRRIATAGFVGWSLDLLSRDGGAERLTDVGAYSAALTKRPLSDMIADLKASGLDYLKGQPFAAADRLGATGFCFGGGMVWNLLASGATLRAAVPFYGPAPAAGMIDGLARTPAAVLAIYAERDDRVNATRAGVEEQLKKAAHPFEIKVYSGVDHAFHNDTGPRYVNPGQAQQAWVATIEWLRRYL